MHTPQGGRRGQLPRPAAPGLAVRHPHRVQRRPRPRVLEVSPCPHMHACPLHARPQLQPGQALLEAAAAACETALPAAAHVDLHMLTCLPPPDPAPQHAIQVRSIRLPGHCCAARGRLLCAVNPVLGEKPHSAAVHSQRRREALAHCAPCTRRRRKAARAASYLQGRRGRVGCVLPAAAQAVGAHCLRPPYRFLFLLSPLD